MEYLLLRRIRFDSEQCKRDPTLDLSDDSLRLDESDPRDAHM